MYKCIKVQLASVKVKKKVKKKKKRRWSCEWILNIETSRTGYSKMSARFSLCINCAFELDSKKAVDVDWVSKLQTNQSVSFKISSSK